MERGKFLKICLIFVLLLGAIGLFGHFFLVANHTSSLPTGFYITDPFCRPVVGDIVRFYGSGLFREIAERRGYIAEGDDFLKPVVAAEGDQVCILNGVVSVNGKSVGEQLSVDGQNRFLPRTNMCRRLVKGELFVLSERSRSFDGRYFGPLSAEEIKGCGRLIYEVPLKSQAEEIAPIS